MFEVRGHVTFLPTPLRLWHSGPGEANLVQKNYPVALVAVPGQKPLHGNEIRPHPLRVIVLGHLVPADHPLLDFVQGVNFP